MLRRICRKKTLIWTGIVFAILAVLVLIFIAEENWRGRRAWETYRAAAEKRGVKLFLKDFIPPDMPDAENYAAIPLIRDLFAKPKEGETPPNPFKLPVAKLPDPPNDIKGRRFDLAGWQEYFLKTKLLTEKTDSAANDILRALEKYDPALQQLRDASVRPKCKFPTHWEDGAATQLPHLTFCQAATWLFCLRAQTHLALGSSSAALAELKHALRLERAYESELSLIAGLVRISSLGMIEYSVWDGLAGRRWADEELTALEKHFAELRLANDCRFVFATERGFGNAAFLDLAKNGYGKILDQMKPLEELGLASKPTLLDRLIFHMMPSGWAYEVMRRNNGYFDWLFAQIDDPNGGSTDGFFPLSQQSREWLESNPVPLGVSKLSALLMDQSLAVFDNAQKKYLYAHTRTQQTRLACTLERFRRVKGGFPEKLDALVPGFIDAIPKDAFDGKPLRYRRNADGGYDLWSIGSDRKDDGGHIDPNQKSPEAQDDWIWHMPGQPEAP